MGSVSAGWQGGSSLPAQQLCDANTCLHTLFRLRLTFTLFSQAIQGQMKSYKTKQNKKPHRPLQAVPVLLVNCLIVFNFSPQRAWEPIHYFLACFAWVHWLEKQMRYSSLTPRLLMQARKCLTFPSNMLLTRCGHTGYKTKGALLGDRPKGSS